MHRLATLVPTLALIPLSAVADGPRLAPATVLPPEARLHALAYPQMLSGLVLANVIGMNCPEYRISDGGWELLTGAADIIAERMGLSVAAYDDDYYRPAFSRLDEPDACVTFGPKVAAVLAALEGLGGMRGGDPVADEPLRK